MPDITGDVRQSQIESATSRTGTVRALNDQFRRSGSGGYAAVTPGISALGMNAVATLVDAIRDYDAFDDGNDPYGEHDMGALTFQGSRVFWKIDYYDRDLRYGSPDPSDPSVTIRMMTIMLASEY